MSRRQIGAELQRTFKERGATGQHYTAGCLIQPWHVAKSARPDNAVKST